MAKKITSTKWAPDLGISGNSKGEFTFVSTVTLKVYDSGTGVETSYPAGTNKISVNRTASSNGKSLNHVFAFKDPSTNKNIYTHVIRILPQPLVSMSWTPDYPFDPNAGPRNGYGIANLKAIGTTSVTFFGTTIEIPTGQVSKRANLPVDIAYLFRSASSGVGAWFNLRTTGTDGQEKILRIELRING